MENSKLIQLINSNQNEGHNYLYNSYSEEVFKYTLKIVGDKQHALNLVRQTFFKIKEHSIFLNSKNCNIFAWLIEETIQVIMENCSEKFGEIRKNIIEQTNHLYITDTDADNYFSIDHTHSKIFFLRKSA